ncbi:CarD family transcriptional regulator, partial [Acinetobacter baumannii]
MESSQNNTKTEYTPNEYVSYGTSGVCQIVSVEQRSFDGEHEESYY